MNPKSKVCFEKFALLENQHQLAMAGDPEVLMLTASRPLGVYTGSLGLLSAYSTAVSSLREIQRTYYSQVPPGTPVRTTD